MENIQTLPSNSLNVIELIAQASFLVQIVMLILSGIGHIMGNYF